MSNMVSKYKKTSEKEQESDTEGEELHHITRIRTGVTIPQNYKRLARGSEDDDSDYSAIASLWSYTSSQQKKTTSHMGGRSDDINQRIEAQDRLIQE